MWLHINTNPNMNSYCDSLNYYLYNNQGYEYSWILFVNMSMIYRIIP